MAQFFLSVVLICMLLIGAFMTGVWFATRMIGSAQDDAEYRELKTKYYDLAGYRRPGDPKPYVPPRTPRNRILPGMGALDRVLKEGKRGTVMWRAGDWRNEK